MSKSHTLPSPSIASKATSPFDIIHTNVWGIAPTLSSLGYKYYVTFVDDSSRSTWIYFLHKKSESAAVFQKLYNHQSDFGGEYLSVGFASFMADKGIVHKKSCPHTPQQNGIAERKNMHIMESARALLLEGYVPLTFWCEVAHTAVHLISRLPTSVLHQISPFESLFGQPPSYCHLRVFSSLCFVHLPPNECTKLTYQAARCAFICYSDEHKGFCVMILKLVELVCLKMLFFGTHSF